ncbi:MAG: recombinase RecT, partial [Thermoanaerobaculia bacterium]|nr:recombinase RecT [Thermoanaerobaculia bacterium]
TQASLFQCLYDLSALGLEPDGRRAHLIPYGDKCTLVIDFKGLAELVRRSGEVADLHADVICENDDFSYCFGTGSHLKHKVDLRKPRGVAIGAYSYVRLKDGSDSFEVLGVDEINAVRDNSQGYKMAQKYNKDDSPWMKHWNEMAKKTAFRRHSKWLPLSPELRDAIEKDDEPEALSPDQRAEIAKPIFGASEATVAPVEVLDAPAAESDAPAPAENQAASDATPAPQPAESDIDRLGNLMLDHGISESALIKWAQDNKHVAATVTTVHKIPATKLKLLVGNFDKIVAALTQKQEGAQ